MRKKELESKFQAQQDWEAKFRNAKEFKRITLDRDKCVSADAKLNGPGRSDPLTRRITLDPEETQYLTGLIAEPYSYFKTLAGSPHASERTKRLYAILERLRSKLES